MSYAPPAYTPPPSQPPKGYQAVDQSDVPAAVAASGSAQPYTYSDEPRVEGDVDPEDFKYSVTVDQATPEIRQQFLTKVYTILFLQLLGTTIVGAVMSTAKVSTWVQSNQWMVIVSLFGSLISMGFLYWKRHAHPANLMLLGLFTLLESISVGAVVSYVDEKIVLQALIITTFAFLGLTLFTIQSKLDFSGMGSWLFGGLMIIVGAGFVQMFIPYSKATDLAFAVLGCIVFCGYIVYDTWLIQKRLSPEDWVLANLSLYLDIINLFINILRILNGTQHD